jgi:hypothetical protein
MCLKDILIRLTPSIVLPRPLSPLYRTISTGFIVQFSYMSTKYIHHIHHLSLSPYALPPPILRKDLFYFPVFNILNCILIVQGGFTLVFQTCVYHASIRLTPYCLTLSVSSCFPVIQQLTVHCIIFSSHTNVVFQYFSLSNILSLSPMSPYTPQTDTLI